MAEVENFVLQAEGSVPADPLGSAARERIAKRRGRKPSAQVGNDRPAVAESLDAGKTAEELQKYQEALSRLFSPTSWERVICAPFDTALMITGAPEFDLPKPVREDLGADMALVLQFWGGGVDPKYLVLIKAGADLTSVMSNCWFAYKTRKLEEAMAEQRKRDHAGV
jgi:hypothetical protein